MKKYYYVTRKNIPQVINDRIKADDNGGILLFDNKKAAHFANGEWHYADNGLSKLKNYLTDILVEHRDDIEAFAELIILSNMKAWEHADRKNENWARLYSKLYHSTRNLYAEWFDDKPNYVEALQYYMKYVD